jgi:hypothetical protein
MRQSTTKELYAYWDHIRNGRIAPCRFEIDPAEIAGLLPETFIVAYEGRPSIRFRLAGTKICEQFGRELRGMDFMGLWTDRDAAASLIGGILKEGGVGHGRFHGTTTTGRQAEFELLLLPLIHNGTIINRLLGAVTAIDPPFWLGSEPLERLEFIDLHHRRGDDETADRPADRDVVVHLRRRPFRVIDGGRTRFVP